MMDSWSVLVIAVSCGFLSFIAGFQIGKRKGLKSERDKAEKLGFGRYIIHNNGYGRKIKFQWYSMSDIRTIFEAEFEKLHKVSIKALKDSVENKD